MNHKELMKRAVLEGGSVAMRYFRQNLKVHVKKEDKSFFTEADTGAEEAIIGVLSKDTDYAVLGEESGLSGEGKLCWVIDPIDGTTNFVQGMHLFCIMIALVKDGVPVEGIIYDPVAEEFIYGGPEGIEASIGTPEYAENASKPYIFYDAYRSVMDVALLIDTWRDVFIGAPFSARDIGSCGYSFFQIALGRADAYVGAGQKPWDLAAGMAILRAAGFILTDWEGEPLSMYSKSSLIAKPALHKHLLGLKK